MSWVPWFLRKQFELPFLFFLYFGPIIFSLKLLMLQIQRQTSSGKVNNLEMQDGLTLLDWWSYGSSLAWQLWWEWSGYPRGVNIGSVDFKKGITHWAFVVIANLNTIFISLYLRLRQALKTVARSTNGGKNWSYYTIIGVLRVSCISNLGHMWPSVTIRSPSGDTCSR